MGADAMIGAIGVRWHLGLYDEVPDDVIERLEMDEDPRQKAAEAAGLDTYWGRTTDGGPYYLIVGHVFRSMGLEGSHWQHLPGRELASMFTQVAQKLAAAGLPGPPELHLQLEADY